MSDNKELINETEDIDVLDDAGAGEYGPVEGEEAVAADDISGTVENAEVVGSEAVVDTEVVVDTEAVDDSEAVVDSEAIADTEAVNSLKEAATSNVATDSIGEAPAETVTKDATTVKKLTDKKNKLIAIVAALALIVVIILCNVIVQAVKKNNSESNQPSISTSISKDKDDNKKDEVDSNTEIDDEQISDVTDEDKDEDEDDAETEDASIEEEIPVEIVDGTPVEVHGKLAVDGTQLVDCHGNAFQIKGVSTHGIAWFPQYVNLEGFRTIRDEWGANCIRIAMYSGEYNGYCTGGNQNDLKNIVNNGVDYATQLGMYVIIDWHVLGDQNPNTYKTQAKSFFTEMSSKYADYDNVLYEICNEPNGGTTWSDVKSYAEEVIPLIKANDPDAVIIVGTPTWSQDVNLAAADPITGYTNIMYALHFYADTHRDDLRNRMVAAINSGLPIFVTEFGICDASGSGANNYTEGEKWIELMNQYKVSYNIWSLCNKNETASLISSGCSKTGNWTTNDLSASGQWYVGVLGKNVEPGSTTANNSTANNSAANNNTANNNGNNNTGNNNTGNNNTGNNNTGNNNTGNNNTGNNNAGNNNNQGNQNTPTPDPTPDPTPTPTPDPTPVTPAATGSASASASVAGSWGGGAQIAVTVSAAGGNVSGWTLVLDFGKPVTVNNIWGGTATVSGNTVIVTPVDYTHDISEGKSVEFGMIVNADGDIGTPSVFVQ